MSFLLEALHSARRTPARRVPPPNVGADAEPRSIVPWVFGAAALACAIGLVVATQVE